MVSWEGRALVLARDTRNAFVGVRSICLNSHAVNTLERMGALNCFEAGMAESAMPGVKVSAISSKGEVSWADAPQQKNVAEVLCGNEGLASAVSEISLVSSGREGASLLQELGG